MEQENLSQARKICIWLKQNYFHELQIVLKKCSKSMDIMLYI